MPLPLEQHSFIILRQDIKDTKQKSICSMECAIKNGMTGQFHFLFFDEGITGRLYLVFINQFRGVCWLSPSSLSTSNFYNYGNPTLGTN